MLGKYFGRTQVSRHLVPRPCPPRSAKYGVRAPVRAPAGHGMLEEKTGCVTSVLAQAEESLHFARCAAFGKHEARKEDAIDSTLHHQRHVAKGREQFIELLRGDH